MMLAVFGPTATGKTDLAINLAKKFNGELISADSRQVYKNLDIGTGKVSFESKAEKHYGYWIVDGVKINGFDLVEPGQDFSVANFLKSTHTSVIQITELGKLPIVVGGTGFYIKSLLEGIGSIGISQNPELRKKLQKLNTEELFQKLLMINRNRAKSMNESDRANPRRLIRAIEIVSHRSPFQSSKLPHRQTGHPTIQHNYLLLGLTAPNQFLYERADKWLETRLKKGLIEEVNSLINQKVNTSWLKNLGLEYRWLTRYVLGEIDYNYAISRLKGDIHSYIRRQKTYFNQFKKIEIFDISKSNWKNELEKSVYNWYNQKNGSISNTNQGRNLT